MGFFTPVRRFLTGADLAAYDTTQRALWEQAPTRQTLQHPIFLSYGGFQTGKEGRPTPKLNTRRLRTLSERPIPRAAINTVLKEIAALKWDVRVKKTVTRRGKHDAQIAIARRIFDYPNPDDSCRTLVQQFNEDSLVGDYGCLERIWTDNPDHPLWLYPVDGSTIQIYLDWDGDPNKPRYAQVPWGAGAGHEPIELLDDHLIYMIDTKRTNTPFGFSPLEAAAQYIDWLLQTQTFAAKSSAHAIPKKLLNLGMNVDPTYLDAFRSYWKREVEGQGKYPIIAGTEDPSVLDLGPQNDEGLYLKWQEMLISIIAVSFDLNPQDLGMQFDGNRSNSVMQTASTKSGAIRPRARLIEETFTRQVLSFIGFDDLEFVYLDVEPTDVKTMAVVHSTYVEADVYTLGQVREMLGESPFGDERDDMTRSEYLAWLGEKYPSSLGPGQPQPGNPSPAGRKGGTKGHGRSTGRPNGAIETST